MHSEASRRPVYSVGPGPSLQPVTPLGRVAVAAPAAPATFTPQTSSSVPHRDSKGTRRERERERRGGKGLPPLPRWLTLSIPFDELTAPPPPSVPPRTPSPLSLSTTAMPRGTFARSRQAGTSYGTSSRLCCCHDCCCMSVLLLYCVCVVSACVCVCVCVILCV